MSQTSKNVSLNTIGTFLYFFCQWVTTVVVVRIVGYEQAGVFALVISYTNFFGFIARYGMRNFQVSDVQEQYSLSQYFSVRVIICAISLVIALAFIPFMGFNRVTVQCAVVYMMFKILESATDYIFGNMQKYERYDWIAISFGLKGILPLLGFTVGLFLTKQLLIGLLAMTVLYLIVVLLYDLPLMLKKEPLHFDFTKTKELLIKCFPLALFTVIVPFMTFWIRYTIKLLCGETQLGYYSSISAVIVIMSTLVGSVWYVIIPVISHMFYASKIKEMKHLIFKIILAVVFVGIAAVILGELLGEWAFSLVFGKGIANYMYLLAPTVVASMLLMLSTFLSTVLIPLQKRTQMLLCNIAGAMVCALTAGIFTKIGGMNGATYSFILSICVTIAPTMFLIIKFRIIDEKDQN